MKTATKKPTPKATPKATGKNGTKNGSKNGTKATPAKNGGKPEKPVKPVKPAKVAAEEQELDKDAVLMGMSLIAHCGGSYDLAKEALSTAWTIRNIE
jgi:hypothetical protein